MVVEGIEAEAGATIFGDPWSGVSAVTDRTAIQRDPARSNAIQRDPARSRAIQSDLVRCTRKRTLIISQIFLRAARDPTSYGSQPQQPARLVVDA